jgi:hypothetical protein
MDNLSNELHNQKDLNKENVLVLTSKPVNSKRKHQKILQKLQVSKNLKKQAKELKVGYKFENWEHVNQVLYTYAKIKGFV